MQLGQRTKSEELPTALRILEHARKAFNQRGVAAVGVRDIARELGLSPGNVSYHFPTKEALVVSLIGHVHAENNRVVAAPVEPLDFRRVDALIRNIMQRDLDNQWLMRDCIGLLMALPALRRLSGQMQRAREARVELVVERLIAARLLDRKRSRRGLGVLRQQLFTQIFFWLPSAIVAAPDENPAERLDAHRRAVMALFVPYCSPAGLRQLRALLA